MNLFYVFLVYVAIGFVIIIKTFDTKQKYMSNGEIFIAMLFMPSFMIVLLFHVAINSFKHLMELFSNPNIIPIRFKDWWNERQIR